MERTRPERWLGRFRLDRLVKEAGGVSTWLASPKGMGGPVVLKTAPREALSPGQRMRLDHEAEVLEGLSSPWVARLVDRGQVDGCLYLALEHVPGDTLEERLRRGPLAVREAVRLGLCLFGGLEAAHALGILHRDLKPSNLLLDGDRAVLLDFGLSRSALLPDALARVRGGTARYMAPEAAGLIPQDVGPAADLYSAGVVLYEALAGRPPFPQSDLGDLLRAHLSSPVPALGPATPRALAEILARLLRKDPRDRYRSASAVRRDLEDLDRALEEGQTDPPVAVGRHDRRDTLAEPAFVGRETELRALERAWREAADGQARLVRLAGPSGSGKSRLMEEAAAMAAGALVVRGRASESARSPLQVLAAAARSLAWAASSEVVLRDRIRSGVRGWERVCATLLPELSDLLDCAPLREGRETLGESSSLQALTALLRSLGSPGAPALVILDDVQWADDLTVRLLQHLELQPLAHTLVLAGSRGPGGLALEPLSRPEVERLLASMGGNLPPRAAEIVCELSDGSPFLAAEIARGMAQAGILRPGEDGWALDEGALDRLQTSDRAAALLRRRLDAMPPATLRLLSLGALLGREFGLEPLAHLVGRPEGLISWLDEARRAGVLWSDAAGSRFTFSHDRLRDGCLGRLDPEERPILHRLAGEWLAEREPSRVHAMAWHFRCAGDLARAVPCALAAAAESQARYDLEGAEENYRLALLGGARAGEDLADVLAIRGRYPEAGERYRAELDQAQDEEHRARLLLKLSDLAAKQQNLVSSRELAEEALRTLGQPVPPGDAACVLALLAEAAVHLARRGRTGSEPASARDRLAVRLCERLMVANFFVDRWAAFLWAQLRGLNLAERRAPSPELATLCGLHVPVAAYLGLLDRATRFGERGLAIAEAVGDPVERARALIRAAFADLHAGRLARAVDRYQRALEVLQQFGDPWDRSILRQNLAHALYLLGRLEESAEVAYASWDEGRAVGDLNAMFTSLRYLVRATGGELPPGGLPAELTAIGGDYIRQLYLLEALGVSALHRGELELAVELLEAAVQVGRRRSRPLEYASTLSWLTTALRLLAEREDSASGRPPELFRRARRAARSALEAAKGLPPFQPHPLREAALLAAGRGQKARARRLLERSLELCREMGMEHQEALTLQARARVERSEEDEARARRLLRRVGAWWDLPDPDAPPETLSVLDRYDQVLEAGRRIASARGRDEVFAAVEREGASLFRSPSCRMVELSADPPLRTLVAAAVASADAVTLDEGLPAGPSDSALLAGVRSAVACAVRVQGAPVACLCVTHREVGGLFTEEDRRLARYLAAAAGAALESDLGWQSLQDSERSLQSLFEGAGVGLAVVDAAGQVLRANPTLEEMLGRPLEGVSFLDFVPGEDRPALRRLLARPRFSREQRCWGPRDRLFWGQLTVTALAPGRAVLSLADISFRRLREVARFQEHERRLLSAELHDVVAQPLAALAMELERLGAEQAFATCEDLLRHLGGLVFNLRAPSTIRLAEGAGLLLQRFARETGVGADLQVEGDLESVGDLPALFAYRILQEALNNVRRHARASRVEVRLEVSGRRLRGRVADDGQGFDPAEFQRRRPQDRHFGLVGMRERAELIGGSLHVRRLDPGTEITFELQSDRRGE